MASNAISDKKIKQLAANRKYKEANKERLAVYSKQYREANRARLLISERQHRQENKEKIKEYKKNNSEKNALYQRKYRLKRRRGKELNKGVNNHHTPTHNELLLSFD